MLRISIGAVPGYLELNDLCSAFPSTPLPDALPGQVAYYTSATTGRPKGVRFRLPHSSSVWKNRAHTLMDAGIALEGEHVHLCGSMMYHCAPLQLVAVALNLGHPVVITRRLEPLALLALIETHRVTSGFIPPSMLARLAKLPDEAHSRYSTASLQWIVHAGSQCAPDIKRRMIELWGPILWDDYGSSESGNIAMCSSREWLERPGTVGRPGPHVRLKILDDHGTDLPRGEAGLIYIALSSGQRFEYHGDAEKTRACYRGDFFTVGDIGYLDDAGYLLLCDRAANVIVVGGVKIYSAEIEQALILHPQIADCAVFGQPDDLMGESVAALVEPMAGVTPGAELTRDIVHFLRTKIAPFKLPRRMQFIDRLPRSPSGKLVKRDLHAMMKTSHGKS